MIWRPCWLVIAPRPSLICHLQYTCQPWTLLVFAETFTAETVCWQLGCATLTERGALWVLQQQRPIVWVDRLTERLPACSFYKINIPATDSPPPPRLSHATTLRAALDSNSHQMLYSYVNVHMCNYSLTHLSPGLFTLFSPCPLPQLEYRAGTALTLSNCPVFRFVRRTGCKFITSFWAPCRLSLACPLLLDWSVCVCSR